MTICREWSLVNHHPSKTTAICLKCRSWTCEHCRPERRRQLMAQAASGAPNRFITLTINPREPGTPDEHLKMLSHAWRVIVQRLRRRNPKKAIEYLAVVEATKRGEPHLHILFRGPFVKQSVLSTWMNELTGSPIVDIRRIKNTREVVRYVAKYITKQPAQFGTSKRYWQSTNYQLERAHEATDEDALTGQWFPAQTTLAGLAAFMTRNGYTRVEIHNDRLTGIPPPYEGEYTSA